MADRIDFQEFVGGFVVEADELLKLANGALLEIDAGLKESSPRPKSVRELFRALHTIKGLASMIGIEPIVELAHAAEVLVRGADRSGGRLRRDAVDVCLTSVRAIGERVRAVAEGRPVDAAPDRLLDAIAAVDAQAEPAGPAPSVAPAWDDRLSASERTHLVDALRSGRRAWSLVFQPSDDKSSRGISITTVRERIAQLGEIVKVVPRALPDGHGIAFDLLVLADHEEAVVAEAAAASEVVAIEPPADLVAPLPDAAADHGAVINRAVVRVELDRLDALQDQLSALIVSRFRLEREIAVLASRGIEVRSLRELADLQARQLRELRRAILRARLVRVAESFEPLELLVRSLNRASGREAHLVIDAGATELDKAVADRLLPAIVHLVRNAIDHAIEPADEREREGKPPAGTVTVRCRALGGNQLELEIADDGRGIDREAVGRRARRNVDDDRALLDVLTTPGFSTRDVATRTSGRGVGMDVVKQIVLELGGELEVQTERGAGTRFTMRVPLTIAIVEVFSFECAGQPFVIPIASVEEIIEVGETVAPSGGSAALIARRGRAVPLISLEQLLALGRGAAAKKALIVRRGAEVVAFSVDRMLGRQEVVVRPLVDPLSRAPGVAGSTDLGDGRPTLVLDLGELADTLVTREASA